MVRLWAFLMKWFSIFSVTLKSAMTPSFIGLMATMLPGVRPSISLASLPTASTSPVFLLMATIEGSLTTMPLPRAYTSVLAVPRSMARSLENILNNERRLCERDEPLLNPLFDIALLLSSGNSSRPWNLGLRPVPFASLSPAFFYSTFLLFYFDIQENWLSLGHRSFRTLFRTLFREHLAEPYPRHQNSTESPLFPGAY